MAVIELLYVPGCPHVERVRETTERVLDERGSDGSVRLVDIGNEEQARRVGFLGSPTLRIDGVDVEPGAGRQPGLGVGCMSATAWCPGHRPSSGSATPPHA